MNNVISNQMEVSVFIENIQKAFGEKVQLPFAFWYSDKQINDDLKKINGCFFKEFEKLIGGEPISLSADRIGCMGGKFYTGFSTMNEKMPMFVSSKEKYKKSSELYNPQIEMFAHFKTKSSFHKTKRII